MEKEKKGRKKDWDEGRKKGKKKNEMVAGRTRKENVYK